MNDIIEQVGLSTAELQSHTVANLISNLVDSVQLHIDLIAQTRNYDSIMSACTYATSAHLPFMTEGQACVEWRDSVWLYCYQVMAEVQSGTRSVPTPEELIAELPPMTWGT